MELYERKREDASVEDATNLSTMSGTKITLHRSGSVDITLEDSSDDDGEVLERVSRTSRLSSGVSSYVSRNRKESRASTSKGLSASAPLEDSSPAVLRQFQSIRKAQLFESDDADQSDENEDEETRGQRRSYHEQQQQQQYKLRSSFLSEGYRSSSPRGSRVSYLAPETRLNQSRSAAVVSAMTALQERIRSLERDLDASKEKVATLRSEVERAHGKSERLTDKVNDRDKQLAELNAKLKEREEALLEERMEKQRLTGALENAQEHGKKLEDFVASLNSRIGELQTRVEEVLKSKHDIEEHLQHEMKEIQDERADLSQKIEFERMQRRDLQRHKEELEEYVQNISELNQTLVARLTAAVVAEKKAKKKKKQRVGSRPGGFHTQRRAQAKKAPRSQQDSLDSESDPDQELVELRDLAHSSFNSFSRSRSLHRYADDTNNRSRRRSSSVDSLDKQLERANLGQRVPFIPTASATPSFSIYARTQSALSDDRAYGLAPPVAPPSDHHLSLSQGSHSLNSLLHHSNNNSRPPSRSGSSHPSVKSESSPHRGFEVLKESLRQELEGLKEQYEKALGRVSDTELEKGVSVEHSRELARLVERIEQKAQQLLALERLKAEKERSPVRSPKAFDKKVSALRALNQYRQSQTDD